MSAHADQDAAGAKLHTAAAFGAAAVAAATASTPEAFLLDVLPQFASLLEVTACALLLDDAGSPWVAASHGLPDETSVALEAGALPPGFSASWSVPLLVPDGRTLGLFIAYVNEPHAPPEETLQLATEYGSVTALALDRLREESGLAARYHAVVVALTSALDARDEYTGRHSTETSNLAERVGRRLGMSDAELELLAQVAVLHDVGKLGIPTQILLKPGVLDTDEHAVMREHPVIGQRILSSISGLGEVATAVRHEHERWDGFGYPDGLAGEQVPLTSRVVFACDAWHAMTSDRPYRPAMAHADALNELRNGAGTQFDPRVAQALLQILGDHAPPAACSPSESRDRELSRDLVELAAELGAEDLFVFRKVAGRLYSHLGGVGRGAGWAGNIELDSSEEQLLRAVIATGAPMCVELEGTGRIVGPYYGRSAVVVPCADETVVVFGSATDAVAGASTQYATQLAERARELVVDVSPAKRLADELEVLAAVREVTTVNGDSMTETLAAIAACARTALSAEYAAVATIPSSQSDPEIGISAGDWRPRDHDVSARALARFAASPGELPMLCQDLSEMPDAPDGFSHADGVSSMHVLPIGSPAVAVMVVVHAEPGLRGFTALCQRVASGMSDAAELVVRRAIAQERLRSENARLEEKVRTDALTGVASRSAWEEALRAQELHRGRSGAPVSVVIVDVDGLKVVNDEAGHAAGDELLRRCARVLADSVRATDVVARIGGDEFGVMLRYSDAEQAEAWCARLEAGLRVSEQDLASPSLRWSVGCASVPPHDTIAAALNEADRRMYQVKLARRSSRR